MIKRGGVNIPLVDFAIGNHQKMMPTTDDDDSVRCKAVCLRHCRLRRRHGFVGK